MKRKRMQKLQIGNLGCHTFVKVQNFDKGIE